MRLYIAYSSKDKEVAEQIQLALLSDGQHFRKAIGEADMVIFLISAASVHQGCYALTELRYARERWPHPGDHVLPVKVAPVSFDEIPAYLRAVTVLEPEGNVAAEVAQALRARQHSGTRDSSTVRPSLKSLSSVLLYSVLVATGFGTLFSFVYRRITIDLPMALLFLVAALCVVLVVRGLWHRVRSS
jgi:hypothetical protein